MHVLVPYAADRLDGPFVSAENDSFAVLAARDETAIIEFSSRPEGVEWFDDFEMLYCRRQPDQDAVTVIRKATDEELRQYRVPLWIQDEDVPTCCGRPMYFVGQLDDNKIYAERPPDAKFWWHDVASFYVFTCSECLNCAAVGQQF